MKNLPPTVDTYLLLGGTLLFLVFAYYSFKALSKLFFDYLKRKKEIEMEEKIEQAKLNNFPQHNTNKEISDKMNILLKHMSGINERNTGISRIEFDSLQKELMTFEIEMRNRINNTDEKLNKLVGKFE